MTNKPEFRKEKLNRKPSSRVNSFNKVYSVIVNKDGSTSIIFGDATEGGDYPLAREFLMFPRTGKVLEKLEMFRMKNKVASNIFLAEQKQLSFWDKKSSQS